ncbi:hypothetical protein [Intestinirhabdus alba]|jgi:tetratricopeptide (TPR) repeat protein|uniref:hypothetical protein n=1 Tax=Intestinirhabdus alba TaxID=2899544 RepID=UPI001E6347B9|nr:hypothetical protein [Intestinirhabdus alba]
MLHKGENQQALDYIRGQIQKVRDAGENDVTSLEENEAEALIVLGRYDEALSVLANLCEEEELQGCCEQTRQTRLMIRAEAFACMGKIKEASDSLIHWSQLQLRGVVRWVRIIEKFCHYDLTYNTWQTGGSLQQILERHMAAQAWRAAIDTALIHIRLAIARGATWTARRALAQAKTCLPHLRKPCGADVALAELERELAGKAQEAPLPVPAEALYGWLEERARLRFKEDHDDVYYLAQRTGPATASVIQPGWHKHPQHLNDTVVFDVALLNTPPEDEAGREYFIGLYDSVEILAEGGYAPSWFIDGVHPGEALFNQFADSVRERGERSG